MRWLVELTSVYKSRVSTSCQPPVVVVRLVTVSSDSWTAVVKENLLLFLTGKCFRASFYFTVCTETLKCMLGKVSTLYCTNKTRVKGNGSDFFMIVFISASCLFTFVYRHCLQVTRVLFVFTADTSLTRETLSPMVGVGVCVWGGSQTCVCSQLNSSVIHEGKIETVKWPWHWRLPQWRLYVLQYILSMRCFHHFRADIIGIL